MTAMSIWHKMPYRSRVSPRLVRNAAKLQSHKCPPWKSGPTKLPPEFLTTLRRGLDSPFQRESMTTCSASLVSDYLTLSNTRISNRWLVHACHRCRSSRAEYHLTPILSSEFAIESLGTVFRSNTVHDRDVTRVDRSRHFGQESRWPVG